MSEYEEILGIKIPENTKIKAVTNSSKKVIKDSIFFGFQGTKVHGSKYAEDAIKNGASLVIHDDPLFVKNNMVSCVEAINRCSTKSSSFVWAPFIPLPPLFRVFHCVVANLLI